MKNKNIYTLFVLSLATIGVQGQEKKQKPDLGTEEVTVVRGYDAVVNEAFKLKEDPFLETQENQQKKQVEYTISSFPVASTFVPEKGDVADIQQSVRLRPFANYALASIGNYTNLHAEAFLSEKLNKFSTLGGFARYRSSQGGVKNVLLDDSFSKTDFNVFYFGNKNGLTWKAELGGDFQTRNWYGLPTNRFDFTESILANIDPKHKYNDVYFNATLEFENSPFTSVDLGYDKFWDDYKTQENRFWLRPRLTTRVGYVSDLNVDIVVDYVSSEYKNGMLFNQKAISYDNLSYKNLNLGIQPNVKFVEDNYTLQLGLGIFYNDGKTTSKGIENPQRGSDNKFYVYPQVKATYNLVDNILVAYAGIEGGLKQNSYKDFVGLNPFVSPNLDITPTSQRYDLYLGFRGKLDNNLSFNIKGSYKDQQNQATFVSGIFPSMLTKEIPSYGFGNAFVVEYQNIKTLNLYGEMRYEFESQTSLGIHAQYNHYDTNQQKPWNLPRFKAGADARFEFEQDWFAELEVFYIGERFDRFGVYNPLTDIQGQSNGVENFISKLKGFVDVNIKVGYRPTKNWTVFVKGNNLFNSKYDRFVNYQVQGIQLAAGAMYKFDF
ncbi:TonB-dependent receptor domain-containing protein [Myroides sp. LJL119]